MQRKMTVSQGYWAKENGDAIGYHLQELALVVMEQMRQESPSFDLQVGQMKLELNTGAILPPADDKGNRTITLNMQITAVVSGKTK